MSDIFIPRILQSTAVYWAPSATLDDFGQPSWEEPIEIMVRWDESIKDMTDAEGETFQSRAQVFTDRDVKVKGVLYLGDLTTGMDHENPKNNDGAWEIRRFERTPNFKSTKFVRVAFL